MNNQPPFWNFVKKATIATNFLFVLWILYNGISEGFSGTMVEKASYIALVLLLSCNAVLLVRK